MNKMTVRQAARRMDEIKKAMASGESYSYAEWKEVYAIWKEWADNECNGLDKEVKLTKPNKTVTSANYVYHTDRGTVIGIWNETKDTGLWEMRETKRECHLDHTDTFYCCADTLRECKEIIFRKEIKKENEKINNQHEENEQKSNYRSWTLENAEKPNKVKDVFQLQIKVGDYENSTSGKTNWLTLTKDEYNDIKNILTGRH